MMSPVVRCSLTLVHVPTLHLHAFCIQVRRHLKGQRSIPHQSDQVQVWKQEYKVLIGMSQRRMKDSVDILASAQDEAMSRSTASSGAS